MAILEVVLTGTYFNQQTITRWNYVSSGTPAAVSLSFALASAMGAIYDDTALPPSYPPDTVLAALSALTSNAWDWQQLTVINPYSPTDFYQTPFVVPYGGNSSGEAMSPVMAYGWRTNQVRRDVARGTKRVPGVIEDLINSGGVLNGAATTAVNLIATRMSEVLEYDDEGNILSFTPSVVSKEAYDPNPPPATGNHRAYRYYPTEAEQLDHTAIGVTWQSYDTVRSQTSRQYGHGR